MFRLTRPTEAQIDAFVTEQRAAAFSYPEVGATSADAAPAGYVVDHNRVRLGAGERAFGAAMDALRAWRMSSLGWVSVHPAAAPLGAGETVAVVVHHVGIWSLNACRVVYLVDERDHVPVRKFGFAYGTLTEHGESGEERFTVEWPRDDDSVWYDLYAFSRPGHPLTRLFRPFARRLQRRFAEQSKRAMVDAVNR
jgi:uncharacterized protein (UPF0548 family)